MQTPFCQQVIHILFTLGTSHVCPLCQWWLCTDFPLPRQSSSFWTSSSETSSRLSQACFVAVTSLVTYYNELVQSLVFLDNELRRYHRIWQQSIWGDSERIHSIQSHIDTQPICYRRVPRYLIGRSFIHLAHLILHFLEFYWYITGVATKSWITGPSNKIGIAVRMN